MITPTVFWAQLISLDIRWQEATRLFCLPKWQWNWEWWSLKTAFLEVPSIFTPAEQIFMNDGFVFEGSASRFPFMPPSHTCLEPVSPVGGFSIHQYGLVRWILTSKPSQPYFGYLFLEHHPDIALRLPRVPPPNGYSDQERTSMFLVTLYKWLPSSGIFFQYSVTSLWSLFCFCQNEIYLSLIFVVVTLLDRCTLIKAMEIIHSLLLSLSVCKISKKI